MFTCRSASSARVDEFLIQYLNRKRIKNLNTIKKIRTRRWSLAVAVKKGLHAINFFLLVETIFQQKWNAPVTGNDQRRRHNQALNIHV
jgi:hypothetical protein